MRMNRAVWLGTTMLFAVGGTALAQHVTEYQYDALGRLIKVERSGSEDRDYQYDDAGNIVRILGPVAPIANNDSATINGVGNSTFVSLVANDTDENGDLLYVKSIGLLSNASLSLNGAKTGVNVTANSIGSSSVTYTVEDRNGGEDTATFTLTVSNMNQNPVAVADHVTIGGVGQSTFVSLIANDSDPDGDPLQITNVSGDGNVDFTINPQGTGVTFVGQEAGLWLYSYTISDGNGGTAMVGGTINVQGGGGGFPF